MFAPNLKMLFVICANMIRSGEHRHSTVQYSVACWAKNIDLEHLYTLINYQDLIHLLEQMFDALMLFALS